MIGTLQCLGRRLRPALTAAALVAFAGAGALAQEGHPADAPLVVAMDVGYAPWAMQAPDGTTEGFQVDVMNEIARQLGRPGIEVIDTNFSALFAGLFASRYELIGSPIAITPERAKEMAFTEAFVTNGQAFITLASEPDIPADLEVLRGKEIATNSGSTADKYLTDNAAQYGWNVQRYDKDTDAIQAVIANRAYAALTDVYRGRYSVASNDRIKVGYAMSTDTQVGLALRPDDTEFRAAVENAIECMKLSGKFAEIHQKWFGAPPAAESAMNAVFVGVGAVGFEGYDATAYHVPSCK